MSCRLPVAWSVTDPVTYASTSHVGFLYFPSQRLSEAQMPSTGGYFYDRAFAKWLPTYREAVSPDGSRYAYATDDSGSITTGTVHVVDVATGLDRVIYRGSPQFYVVEFETAGIYLTAEQDGGGLGLYLEDPKGGQARLISSTISHAVVANGFAWGTDFDPADPHPAPGGMTYPQNVLFRYDLRTGARTTWWYTPGEDTILVGADYSGDLFVFVFNETGGVSTLWVVSAAGTAKAIYAYPDSSEPVPGPGGVSAVDSNGVWFSGQGDGANSSTIWLFSGGQMHRIAVVPRPNLSVAGGCIPGT